MANSKARAGAKARKGSGKPANDVVSSRTVHNSVDSSSGRKSHHPPSACQSNSAWSRLVRWLYRKQYAVYCMVGGPVYNSYESVFVYLLILLGLALASMGAYKHLTKLWHMVTRT